MNIGDVFASNRCGDFKVINYIDSRNVIVEFLSTGTIKSAWSGDLRRGLVRDEYYPSVFGVGFMGVGDYVSCVNYKQTSQYTAWVGMLGRCYNKELHKRRPTYIGCTVCDEWHNFQVFAEWYDENYTDGLQLDKDIKTDGNRVYSPDTCIFVSALDNSIKASAKNYKLISPAGVVIDVYNMSKFCKDNNLNRGVMSSVVSGKTSQHKGWRIATHQQQAR